MATKTMKDLMGLRRWALLAAGLTLMSGLVLGLGASEAFAYDRPEPCLYCGALGPTVTEISPPNYAMGVSRNTNIKITFSQVMDPTSVNGDTFKLYDNASSQQIPATVSVVPDTSNKTFVLDPYGSGTGRLDPNKKYRVWLMKDVANASGVRFGLDRDWYFTTANGTAPYVTQVSPPDGATGVSRSANIKVTFSEEMDPSTINTSTLQLHFYDFLCDRYTATCSLYVSQQPATVRKDPTDASGRTFLLDPYGATSSLLSANRRYRVTLTTGARDLEDEYALPSNKVWYFTTGSS
jgi:Bacterial Ig-like domain